MNHRIILRILSRVAAAEAALMAVPALVALAYGDDLLCYAAPILALALYSFLLHRIKPCKNDLYAREGFMAVALSWIQMSLFGALPFWISGEIPSYVDCLFETVSGFTTTGSTILADIESLPQGLLFWRSFTHWIGGMGVLVFLIAIAPLAGDRAIHLMRAEAPGPTMGKLAPRLRSTAAILYGIYFGMTAVQIILLLLGGMPPFDSVTMAFSVAGTGGFSVTNAGILGHNSLFCEIVVIVFMLLFSINFYLYHLALMGRPLHALKNEEMRWFLAVFAVSTLLTTLNILPQAHGFGSALRLAAFQNASIMSSTGFATVDYTQWPEFSHTLILLLMFIGACSGSTGGGFKISRVIILMKSIRLELARMLHPRAVGTVKFEGKPVESAVTHAVLVYLAVYVILAVTGVLLVSINGFDHTTTVTAVLTALNNVGVGLGGVGPMGNFSSFSVFSKLVLSLYMLIGRLEIYPILLLFAPSVWRTAHPKEARALRERRRSVE